MPPTVVQPDVRLLPIRFLRAGMLSYLAMLAALEVGAGMVIAEAWRAHRANLVMSATDLASLSELLDTLRMLEAVVAGGAVATMVAWSFVAIRNASIAGRGGVSGWAVIVTWVASPVLVVVLSRSHLASSMAELSVLVLAMQAIVIYLPFGTLGWAARRVQGRVGPFFRWYLSVVLVFLVHELFTGTYNLAAAMPSDDLGRTAALYLGSALVVGVMVVMAKDASVSMQSATDERHEAHQRMLHDALSRFGSSSTAEHRAQFGHDALLQRGLAAATAVQPVTRES